MNTQLPALVTHAKDCVCVCVCHSLIDLLMSTLKETGSPSWMVPVPVLNSAAQKSHD